ncbi:MAG: hypothetical protein P8130_03415 [Deltaproteobacteria bacterium]
MKRRCLVALAVLASTLMPLAAQAQDARIQELERKLQERDKVILELLDRVEALERRVGTEHAAAESGQTPGEAQKQAAAASAGKEKEPAEEPEGMPGAVVVKEGEAERALERSLTRAGALLLPPGVLEVEPGLTYARKEDSAPNLFTTNGQLFPAETKLNANSVTADLALRLGLPWDAQLEAGLPYRWRELESTTTVAFAPTGSSSTSGAGLGDVRLGLAKTFLREGLWRPDLVGRITWDTDTGKLQDNGVALGSGYNELRGSLTAIKRQAPIAFVGGLSYEHSFEKNQFQAGPVVGANFGSFIALSPETSLRFRFSGAYQDESELSGTRIAGSDRTLATFEVGGTTLLARGTLLNLAVDIGLTDDTDDFAITLSLPVRFDRLLY